VPLSHYGRLRRNYDAIWVFGAVCINKICQCKHIPVTVACVISYFARCWAKWMNSYLVGFKLSTIYYFTFELSILLHHALLPNYLAFQIEFYYSVPASVAFINWIRWKVCRCSFVYWLTTGERHAEWGGLGGGCERN
jgi:hypothetical protein